MIAKKRTKRGRDISGVLVLDKPSGMSSNQALQRVKRFYNANKAGHTGSLDVPATGLLPICLGEATKLSSYLLNADKCYRARCQLGITTTTGDATGTVLERKPVYPIEKEKINAVLQKFIGEIEQVPPMFSALKHNGKRLYELAYQGIEVKRKPRNIRIYQLQLLAFNDDQFEIEICSSKGTYIRTLVQDIGYELSCGAHVTALRRLNAGPLKEQQMITLEQLEETAVGESFEPLDALLFPMDQILGHLPEVSLNARDAGYLRQGQAVSVPGLPKEGRLRIYNGSGQLIAFGEITGDGRVAPKRLIHLSETKSVG